MWCFDSILVHGLPLRDGEITLNGYTTLGMTPLDELSALQRDFYLTTRNTHNTHTSMPPAGFKLTIPASEQSQTHILEHRATGMGNAISSLLHVPSWHNA